MNVPRYQRDIQAAVHLVHMFYEAGVQEKMKECKKRGEKYNEGKEERNAKGKQRWEQS